ncbi:O-methyltransferase [Lachnellula occidentalis]|uniref:O-methyltransferase n=1 Tax=Lachnellula occidentalis TaxID=215460 RepID=A0A8H8S548_9HELO|nr:O-methyltransferase [Lachnellula occidentalis]
MSSRIAELGALISSNTQKIDEYLIANSLPSPSFEENGPVKLNLSAELESARGALLNATAELQALLQTPDDLLRPILNGTSLEAISRYDMARKIPVGGSISFQDLADQCSLYEPDVRRIVRFAIAHHFVFREPRKGFVAHSAASRRLVDTQGARDGLGVMFDDCYQSFGRTIEAIEKYKSQDIDKTGWALAHNGQSLFETFGKHPEKAKRFAGSMAAFNASPLMSHKHMATDFPWETLGNGTVVDLGGSHGELCAALALTAPNLQFIVQELPRTVQSVDRATLPAEVAPRIEFMEHDFFTPQPVVAAVYTFRQIFHNWADANVVKILRSLIPALRSGARVLVHDLILPEPGKLPLMQERQIRYVANVLMGKRHYMLNGEYRAMDMLMLSICNARERDEEDWRQVFTEADSRFKVLRVFTPKGAALGIVDVVWDGEGSNFSAK